MSSAAAAKPAAAHADVAAGGGKKGGKKKLLLLAVPLLLVGALAGLWFGGILPPLLGMGKEAKAVTPEHPADKPVEAAATKPPVYVDLPEIIANLNTAGRRSMFVKLHARLEIGRAEDQSAVQAAMPRLLDLFQTYLREMRPEELHGSAGTWRLREELIARANLAATPAKVVDVLFTDLLIQ